MNCEECFKYVSGYCPDHNVKMDEPICLLCGCGFSTRALQAYFLHVGCAENVSKEDINRSKYRPEKLS